MISARTPDEIRCRNAARSSYYAVFHLMAKTYDMDTSDETTTHWEVKKAVMSEDPAYASDRVTEARTYWDKLYRYRVRADYYPDQPFPIGDAQTALNLAKRIFAASHP